MKLTLPVKLAPSPEQSAALLETMERFNFACNALAATAFRERCANKIALQKLVYHDARERFGLSAQLTIRAIAKDTARGIALEAPGGIRERTTVRRRQRARHANWSFAQLRGFVEYKARAAGVPVVAVDPWNTSRECPACGHVDKANRPAQDRFLCTRCNLAGLPDCFAARVIAARARAVVMQPMVAPATVATSRLLQLAVHDVKRSPTGRVDG
jgi:predicted transposase